MTSLHKQSQFLLVNSGNRRFLKPLSMASVVIVGVYSPLNSWGSRFEVDLINISSQIFIWHSALLCLLKRVGR